MPTDPRLQPPPPVPTPVLDAFIRDLMAVAVRHKVNTLVIAAVDPQTGRQKLYGAPDAMAALRGLIATKFDLQDVAETEWTA